MRLTGLTQTITVRPQGQVSDAGDPTFGQKRTQLARVQAGRDRSETEITHTHVVYTETEIGPGDRVWFPGDDVNDETKARRPVAVVEMRPLSGPAIGWKVLF